MATSGSTDFGMTSREVVTAALVLCGALGQGETASAEDAATGLQHLNLMLKTWGTDPALFIQAEASVTLVAGQAAYTASPVSLARRIAGVWRRTSNIDTPLEMYSRSEYLDEPSKSATGIPRAWYFNPQRSTRTLYVVGVPDATIAASTTLRIDYHRVIEDSDSLNNDPDVPQEWLEAMIYGLAARLCLPMGTITADPTRAAKIEERAMSLVAQLRADSQEEASVFFSPA